MAVETVDDEETEEKETFTYPLYQMESQTPYEWDLNKLAKSYGTAAMPMFQWVKKIQTGEATYTPDDPIDERMQENYEEWDKNNNRPGGMMSPEDILSMESGMMGSSFGAPIGGALTSAWLDPKVEWGDAFKAMVPGSLAGKGALHFGTDQFFNPDTGKLVTGTPGKNLDFNLKTNTFVDSENLPKDINPGDLRQAEPGANIYMAKINKDFTTWDKLTDPGALKSTMGAAGGNFIVQLAMGEDPVKAAKKAGASAIASHVSKALLTPILGPFAGVLGGIVGGEIGGRVICNELHKQGLLKKEQVLMDYKFTRDYLTPKHVNGYHLWAVWVVKQMRKGRMVKFWKHIATHRANEIAYIYGKREKPDYLGKIYRCIGEPVCWLLGTFRKSTDWSILYKETKNG